MTHMLNNRRCFPLKLNHSYFHPVCSTEIKHAAFTTHGMSMNTSLFTLTALTDCQSLPHHTTVQLLPGNICEHIEKKKFSIWQFPALLSLKTCARNWTEHDIAMKDTVKWCIASECYRTALRLMNCVVVFVCFLLKNITDTLTSWNV